MCVCDLNIIKIDDPRKWLGIDVAVGGWDVFLLHISQYYTAAEVKWNVFNGKCLESFWQ